MKQIGTSALAFTLVAAFGTPLAQQRDITPNTPRAPAKPISAQDKSKARDEIRSNAGKALELFYA
jgi:hypothetical protein